MVLSSLDPAVDVEGRTPVRWTLDDTMAMQAGATLSTNERIVIAARVSKSPSAAAKAGDFEGASAPVKNTSTGVDVVIDREVR